MDPTANKYSVTPFIADDYLNHCIDLMHSTIRNPSHLSSINEFNDTSGSGYPHSDNNYL